MTTFNNMFTFCVLTISDIAKIYPGKYSMNYGVCITGKVTQGEHKGRVLTFIAPLGECDPAEPALSAYCKYWQGHYEVDIDHILDGTLENEIQYAGQTAFLLSNIRFNESYVCSLSF